MLPVVQVVNPFIRTGVVENSDLVNTKASANVNKPLHQL